MLTIEKNKDLTPYTTLKIGAPAEFFAVVRNRAELKEAIAWAKAKHQPIWVLGGGSNILISRKIKGLVIKNEIRGMSVIKRTKTSALVEALSGESWTRFVNFTLDNKLYGLENLFLIYGTVGGAPIQNIGAYGVELKDVFYNLLAIDLKTGREKIFSAVDCQFGYRDSIFKNRLKGKYFIYSITVKLRRQPKLCLEYGALREELAKRQIIKPTVRDLIAAIQTLRNSKLPSPANLPNAGSFFKNVEISQARFERLTAEYPQAPSFPSAHAGYIKIPAGWLIEQVGFKGKKIGPVGMYEKQALVLANHGGATAKQALVLVKKVKSAVRSRFGLDLEEEVNII
ncbi:MAG: UDP-N-acetylmuramate dehydrogenase [Patescibacteria group bacterium]